MAKTIIVKSARKSPGSCLSPTCTHESRVIAAGESYKHFSMKLQRGGVKKSYHIDCAIPPSHRTTSRMGEIWDAQEDAERAIPDAPEDDTSTLQSIAEDFAGIVREVGAGYTESADNIEEGFSHATYMSDELREKGEQLDSWADDLESPDFDEFDESTALEEATAEATAEADSDDPVEDVISDKLDEQRQEWWDEQVSKLQETLGNCPV